MATIRRAVTYRLLEVVDHEPGHWCPACALPSAAKITLASIVVVAGVESPLRLTTGLRCMDGHSWLRGGYPGNGPDDVPLT